jgi:hypothetical protein
MKVNETSSDAPVEPEDLFEVANLYPSTVAAKNLIRDSRLPPGGMGPARVWGTLVFSGVPSAADPDPRCGSREPPDRSPTATMLVDRSIETRDPFSARRHGHPLL